jgi:hypothetical protein
MRQRETPGQSSPGLLGNVSADKGQATTSTRRSMASSSGGDAVAPGLPTPTPDKTTDPRPQSLPWYLRIPPGQWFCDQHGRYAPCPEHDCPHCFVADYGHGECAHCDHQTKPLPPVDCPAGEDCPSCPDCGIGPNGAVTCACIATLCQEEWHCPKHAQQHCPGCQDLYGGTGRGYCVGHGWVELCFFHNDCPDHRDCLLLVENGGRPSCGDCQGAGCCWHCHPHCPACWAEGVLRERELPVLGLGPAPPPCLSCQRLLTDAALARVMDYLDRLRDPEGWINRQMRGDVRKATP